MTKRIESVNAFVVKFANVNGSGSASANELFAKSILRMGVPVSPRNIFPSNIQGLPTWYEVRVSESGWLGRRGGVDLMVAMNPQTWDKDLAMIEPGGYRGDWLDVWQRIERELGPSVRHVGLSVQERDFRELDEAFAAHGAVARETVTFVDVRSSDTLALFFEQAHARSFSWTWRADEDELARALDAVEAWARDTYGDLGAVGGEMQIVWRTYDLP